MTKGIYKRTSTKTLVKHPRITLLEDDITLPDGSTSKYLRYKDPPEGVTAIVKKGDKYLINFEYTYPIDEYMYQFPGGSTDKGESPEEAIIRELEEEAGLIASNPIRLGSVLYDHRRHLSRLYLFLITDIKDSTHSREDAEFIELEWKTKEEITQMISNGEIFHFGSVAAWGFYLNKYYNKLIH